MYVEGYLENNEPSHPHTHSTIPSMVATCIVEDFFSNCVRALDRLDLMNSGCYGAIIMRDSYIEEYP